MVIWIIGLSGAGKTTLAEEVVHLARQNGKTVALLDGDVMRSVWGDSLGHTLDGRKKNADRLHRLCRYLEGEGVHVVAPVLSIFQETRYNNRRELRDYHEVYIKCPMEALVCRDSKGLYARAGRGEIELPGVNMRFEEPCAPDLVIENTGSRNELLGYAPILAQKLIRPGKTAYPYTARDLLRDPEKYFYAPFCGKDFVNAWKRCREEHLAVWAGSDAMHPCPGDLTETERELWRLASTGQKPTGKDAALIEGLLRRFEVSKKLPATLEPPRYSCVRASDRLTRPHAYACLGAILALSAAEEPDMRPLNCLLKINDLLCSLSGLPSELFPLARRSLAGELAVVQGWAQRSRTCK